METYDIIMLAVLGIAAIVGAIKGFAWQVASIASIFLSYWVALHFREPFSQQIKADPPWNMFLSMLILFVGTSIAIWIVFRMLSNTIDRMRLREFDRTIGALFGLAKGGIYCILITMFAVSLLGDSTRMKIVESRSGYYIAQVLDYSDKVMPEEIHQVVRPYLDRLDEKLQPVENDWPSDSGFLNWPTSADSSNPTPEPFGQNLPLQNDGQRFDPRQFIPPQLFDQAQQPQPPQRR